MPAKNKRLTPTGYRLASEIVHPYLVSLLPSLYRVFKIPLSNFRCFPSK